MREGREERGGEESEGGDRGREEMGKRREYVTAN